VIRMGRSESWRLGDHSNGRLCDRLDRNPRCAVMASAIMVASTRALRGGQKPAGPILVGYRFEANGCIDEVVAQRWSPRLYFAVDSFSSFEGTLGAPSLDNMRLVRRDVNRPASSPASSIAF
jgi:hypothetical protein